MGDVQRRTGEHPNTLFSQAPVRGIPYEPLAVLLSRELSLRPISTVGVVAIVATKQRQLPRQSTKSIQEIDSSVCVGSRATPEGVQRNPQNDAIDRRALWGSTTEFLHPRFSNPTTTNPRSHILLPSLLLYIYSGL